MTRGDGDRPAEERGARGAGGAGGTGGHSDRVLVLIAIMKLVKVVMLVTLGVGAFKLVGADVGETLTRWTRHLNVDANSRHLHALIASATGIGDRKLEAIGVGTFVYAAVFATEGIGLLMKKRWAEYLTSIVTTSFIPLEIWEMTRHATVAKAVAIALNVATVVYLVFKLKKQRREDRETKQGPRGVPQRSSGSTHLRPSTGKS
jgi:uncharacterized membrane protein (DUF2068 family)